MTETLNKIVVDCSTGRQSIVPLSAEEIAQREAEAAAFAEAQAARLAEEEAKTAIKASAKSKLISGQPLTEEEANTLVV